MNCLSRLTLTAVIAAMPLITNNARAAVGDIYETNTGMVLRILPLGGTPTTLVPDLSNPKGLVFDGNGHIFVADASRGNIYRFNAIDGQGFTFTQGLSSPVGLTFDPTGFLYASDAGSGSIFKFDTTNANRTTFATGLGQPSGMAFDTAGNLFVADFQNGALYKFDTTGGRSTFASNLSFPADVAIDSANNIFVSDSGTNQIYKFTPSGNRSTFAQGLDTPYGLAFEASGNLIVADHDSGTTYRFTPSGSRSILFQSDFNAPQFVAVEPAPHQALNISTRGYISTNGDRNLIAGFIVGGIGPVGTIIVVRAIGPSLPAVVGDRLADPVLEIRDASGTLIAVNDNWQDAGASRVSPPFEPTDPHEAALQLTLRGGAFTAIVYGTGTGIGTAVVEVYHLQL